MSDVMPFGGWIRDERNGGWLRPLETAPHIGCFALSGTGKTRRWLTQSAVLWPGPALVSSSKDDAWQLVSSLRYSGNSYLVDLRPVTGVVPADMIRCQYDPTMLIDTFEDAKYLAHTLLSVANVALNGGYRQVGNADTWHKLAKAALALLLWAASPQCTNAGIGWTLLAAEDVSVMRDKNGAPRYSRSMTSWAGASAWSLDVYYTARVRRILEYEPKMRDSVALGITEVLTPWLDTMSRNQGLPYLTTSWLDDNTATLYLLSTDDGTTAGQAITLIDHLINVQRGKTARGEDRPRLGLFLDEVANTPIPMLPKYLTEARGLGCNICFAAHASSQLDSVYGTLQGRAIVDTVPAVLLLKGAHEERIFEEASFWSGVATRSKQSYSHNDDARTTSRDLDRALKPEELIPRSLDEGRLIVRGSPGTKVTLKEWDEFVPYLGRLRRALTA